MADEAITSDYVRVKRKNVTIFLFVQLIDTAAEVRAKISAVNQVAVNDMRLFLDKNGDVPLDEKKSLADQKARTVHPWRTRSARARDRCAQPCPRPLTASAAARRWRTIRSSSSSSEKKVRGCLSTACRLSCLSRLTVSPALPRPLPPCPDHTLHSAAQEATSGRPWR